MSGKMWFGVRGNMRWVPAPAIDPDFSEFGWSSSMLYLNGGAGVDASKSSHKEYSITWNMANRDLLRPITDYAGGIYDSVDGINLIYFLDPMTVDKNVLPQLWATPSQAKADGLTLFPGQVPTLSTTPANALDLPTRSATYKANTSGSSLYIPIPPGYTAWIGVYGSRTGAAAMQVTPTNGYISGTAADLTMLGYGDNSRFNAHYDGAAGSVDGILLSPKNLGAASTDTVTLSGLMVQILPTGQLPLVGNFVSGQGHSGCQFNGKPLQTPHSAKLDLVAMSAKLVETGSWL